MLCSGTKSYSARFFEKAEIFLTRASQGPSFITLAKRSIEKEGERGGGRRGLEPWYSKDLLITDALIGLGAFILYAVEATPREELLKVILFGCVSHRIQARVVSWWTADRYVSPRLLL